ncbi:MAG: N-6 DNA methylase [Treponema sp.]|nr:N-6 DNA methylase [Treponema sp.]MCL2251696.1 N-6 DNA methylase [Treponema sp.]
MRDEIKQIMDEFLSSGASLDNIDSLSSFLSNKGLLNYENVIEILISSSGRSVYLTPDIIALFLVKFSQKVKAKSILDPFAKFGQVAMLAAKEPESQIHAVCLDLNAYAIMQLLEPKNAAVYSGNILYLDMRQKYDIIVSDLPFGMTTNFTICNERITDMGLAVVAKCINLLKDDGYIVATFPCNIMFNKSLHILRKFEQESLYINAIIDLPVGTYAPYTNISGKILVFKKQAVTNRFVARLSSVTEIDTIINNLLGGNENDHPNLGVFVNPNECADYSIYHRKANNEKLAKLFDGRLLPLREISSAQLPNSNNEFKDEPNSIYIPKTGVSKVVTSMSDFEIKPQNYIQLLLNPELVLDRYAAFFFNTPKGVDVRRNYQIGQLPSFNLNTVLDMEIALPTIDIQGDIIKANSSVIELETQLVAIKQKLNKDPAAYKDIKLELKKIKNQDTLEKWNETLPFPIASILRRYIVAVSDRDKQDALLNFFEALSIYISALFLSLIKHSKDFLEGLEILKGNKIECLKNATFGYWVRLNEEYSKKFKELLNKSIEDRQLVCRVFAADNSETIEILCNEKLHKLLKKASEKRNNKAHGGVFSESVCRNNVGELYELLLEIKAILNDAFDEFQLIRAIGTEVLLKDFINNTVELITSSNSTFHTKTIKLPIGLVKGCLYIYINETNTPIDMIPLLIMGSTLEKEKNACYFYNQTTTEDTKYVSYHYEDKPEETKNGNNVFLEIKDIMKV